MSLFVLNSLHCLKFFLLCRSVSVRLTHKAHVCVHADTYNLSTEVMDPASDEVRSESV